MSNLRLYPRPLGNFFAFPEQKAANVVNLRRFPIGPEGDPAWPVLVSTGLPFPAGVEAQKYFTNAGITHGEGNLMAALSLPVQRRWYMQSDAQIAEDAMAFRNNYAVGSAEYNALTTYGQNYNRQVLDGFYELWKALGRYSYATRFNGGVGIGASDIEVFSNTSAQAQSEIKRGWTTGWLLERNARGHSTPHLTYGIATICSDFVSYEANGSGNNDYPFRRPGADWQGANGLFDPNANEMVQAMRAAGHVSYVGRDKYWRSTHDDGTVFQLNADGSIKADGAGRALWRRANYPNETVTNYGVTARIYTEEPRNWIREWYVEAYKAIADWSFICNRTDAQKNYDGSDTPSAQRPYPQGTSDINPAMAYMRGCSWFRPTDTEAGLMYNNATGQMENIGEPESNRRIVNPRSHRYAAAIRSIFYHANVIWDDKGYAGFTPSRIFVANEGGAQVTKAPLKMGGIETTLAGIYQVRSQVLFRQYWDAGQIDFILPMKPIVKENGVSGEYEWEKPIVTMFKKTGGLEVWALWVWPCQNVNDATHERDMAVWIELPNGTKSASYKLKFKDRNVCFEGWQLPAGFESARAQDFRFQFQTLPVGSPSGFRTITWTGHYNVAFTGANPTPPAYISEDTTTTPPTDICALYTSGQTLALWYGETIKAWRTDDGTLYAAAAADGTGYKNRAWLVSTGQFTTQQAQCFADSNPKSTTPPPPPGTDPFVSYAQALRATRWVGPQIFLYGNSISSIDRQIVETAADNGANLFAPSFHWTNCEPTPGNYDWGAVDAALNLASTKNLKLAIRLVVTRGERNNEPAKNWDQFFTTADRMRDERGLVSRWNGEVAFSYDSSSAVNRAGQFITALLTHIRDSGKANRILAVSVVGNGYYEGEYQSGAQPADGDAVTDQLFDYSEYARQAFIGRMTAKYGTVAAANAAWGTSFGSWGAVQLPIVPRGDGGDTRGQWVHNSTYTRDFYVSRSKSLAAFNQTMAATIRAVSPNIQVFSENGSMYDRNCSGRGSWLLPALTDFLDGRKQNSTPFYPLALIQAINQMGGKWGADEVFCWKDQGTNTDYTLEQNLNHYKGALDAGASMVVLAGPQKPGSGEDANLAAQTLQRIAAIYANLRDTGYISGSPRFDYQDTMNLTTSGLLGNYGWEWWNGNSSLQNDYNKLTANGTKRVRLVLTNDL
ncbi:hypothetical protein FAES_4014 [Fibrella aestuarina BUZ 2]|uniref:Glycoside hydrolase family 42 N-terminal domain-containing protein n=1 Tax=Fibrella aestuarina BUZ 2 TaxID=1166018 RepID=I0KD11_9BACT|nr:beta-galactosidase [Fibrella aestuarina]CCH02014.1 hypothetical protein FAES_4014 [Fibrella aestuarina BUZ 2]